MEILTVDDIAEWLKLSKRQIYEITKTHTRSGDKREHPLPVLRIGASVRFIRADIEEWILKMARKK